MKKPVNSKFSQALTNRFADLLRELYPKEYGKDTLVLYEPYEFIELSSKKPPIARKKTMAKLKLSSKSDAAPPTETEMTQSSIQKQHEITWNRATLGSNLASNGPWIRTQLPLLKTEPKYREFFVRADSFSVVQYYLDEHRNRCGTTLFYPSESWIREYESRKNPNANTVYEKLYEQLKENGLGQVFLPYNTTSIKRTPLKRATKQPIKKISLKKPNGKIRLKTAKKQLKPKKTKLRLKRK
jgi:hypothetical protein